MGDSTPIVLSTVYDPSDGSGELVGVLPPWPEALAMLSELNAAIADLASEFGCLLADVHRAFLGHGSRAGDPGQAEPRPTTPELWYCGVVEPNAWGASAIRAAWWAALC
jgi:hypothetical protein